MVTAAVNFAGAFVSNATSVVVVVVLDFLAVGAFVFVAVVATVCFRCCRGYYFVVVLVLLVVVLEATRIDFFYY